MLERQGAGSGRELDEVSTKIAVGVCSVAQWAVHRCEDVTYSFKVVENGGLDPFLLYMSAYVDTF